MNTQEIIDEKISRKEETKKTVDEIWIRETRAWENGICPNCAGENIAQHTRIWTGKRFFRCIACSNISQDYD